MVAFGKELLAQNPLPHKINLAPKDWQEYHHLVKCSIDDVEMAKYQIQSWDIAVQHAQNGYQFSIEQRMHWATTLVKARRTLHEVEQNGKAFAEAMPSDKSYVGPGMMSKEEFKDYLQAATDSAANAVDTVGTQGDIKNHVTNYHTLIKGTAANMFVDNSADCSDTLDPDYASIKEPEIKRQRASSSSGMII